MIRRSVYDAFDVLEAPGKSLQAFLVDQLDLCVEVLSDIKQHGSHDDDGNHTLLAVQRLSGPGDPGPSYSLFYEDALTGGLKNLDYVVSVIMGARLNHDCSGVCLPEDPAEFAEVIVKKLNAMSGSTGKRPARRFVLRWF